MKGHECFGSEPQCNQTAALLAGIQPQDELESMLAVQMIAVHNMAMHAMNLAMLTSAQRAHLLNNWGKYVFCREAMFAAKEPKLHLRVADDRIERLKASPERARAG